MRPVMLARIRNYGVEVPAHMRRRAADVRLRLFHGNENPPELLTAVSLLANFSFGLQVRGMSGPALVIDLPRLLM